MSSIPCVIGQNECVPAVGGYRFPMPVGYTPTTTQTLNERLTLSEAHCSNSVKVRWEASEQGES